MKNALTAESLTEQTGKVIPFPYQSVKNERVSPALTDSLNYVNAADVGALKYIPTINKPKLPSGVFEALQAHDREIFNLAFDRISHSLNTEFDRSELSNAFDEWKDYLETASRKIESLTSGHRKIIGMMLSLLRDKDISDFNMESLRIFQEATNILRMPRIIKQEIRRITDALVKADKRVMMPLSVNESDMDRTSYLDEMMSQLVAKSNKDQ